MTERLTEIKYNGIVSRKQEETGISCSTYCDSCSQGGGNCKYVREMVKKLEEYETAEEEGRLVVLPCNVGTEVFIIFEYANCGERFLSTKEHVVTDILLNRNRSPLFRITNLFGTMKLEDFGKTVFFTREEAEKALEEANKIE